ncbi:MAG: hypothetical protein RR337_10525, partial [Clostridia bacterium]
LFLYAGKEGSAPGFILKSDAPRLIESEPSQEEKGDGGPMDSRSLSGGSMRSEGVKGKAPKA